MRAHLYPPAKIGDASPTGSNSSFRHFRPPGQPRNQTIACCSLNNGAMP